MSQRCRKCGIEKPLDAFYARRKSLTETNDIRRRECKECHHQRGVRGRWKKEYNDNRRGYIWATNLYKYYGLTPAGWQQMSDAQDGRCAICQEATQSAKGRRLAVDHDHMTEQVRGLLCGSCNRGLGGFKDSAALLTRAVGYLQRYARVAAR